MRYPFWFIVVLAVLLVAIANQDGSLNQYFQTFMNHYDRLPYGTR